MKKSVFRIVMFLIIISSVLISLNKIFEFKYIDGIYSTKKLYELEDNTVDVLFLGSSHAFEDFNTGVLWDEYGMASYIFAGSVQPLWNTYYYLKEALKFQTPKLIVLEGYMTTWEQEYIDNDKIIKNNFGLKWSIDKLNSISVSAPRNKWKEFVLEYVQYHTRYSELSDEDFAMGSDMTYYNDWKGFACNMKTTPYESVDISHVHEKEPLYNKTEEYYRKIIELAYEKNIPIVIAVSPYAEISEKDQRLYNSAKDIADEYGVTFVNFNLFVSDMELDYSEDVSDGAHLNYRGNQKFTKYFGDYLKKMYSIPDRRNDKGYISWQRNADYVRQTIYNQCLIEASDISTISELLNNPNYWVIISGDGNYDPDNEDIKSLFEKNGIYNERNNGIWMSQYGIANVWKSGIGDAEKYISIKSHDFLMKRKQEENTNTILIDNENYVKVENGINVVVYDEVTDMIIDSFSIDADEEYEIDH